MRKILFLLLSVIMCSAAAMAQRTVTGTVVSAADNEPVIGATILPLPSSGAQGVATDVDGRFSISVPQNCHTLQVSYIGMATQKVRIPANGKVEIKLVSENTELDDVIVVAYGTTKRSEYTGSASVVKADQIENTLTTTVTSALNGKVAGVQLQSSDGAPGQAPTIRIRGVGSINASANPLIVLDGMPFDGTIADIAPNDVESMTVLKDAASTALFGARGANGVIMITTKRGGTGEAKVSVDMRWGANDRAIPNYNVLTSANMYNELVYEAFYNQYTSQGYSADVAWRNAANKALTSSGYQIYTVPQGEYLVGRNGKINPNATLGYSDGTYYYTPDDWTDNTMRNGFRQEYNVSVSGGNDKIKYYVSGNYLENEGIVKSSGYNRFNTRATVDYQAKKWLKIGTSMAYTYSKQDLPGDNDLDYATSSGNMFYIANQIAPIYPMFVRDAEGQVVIDPLYGYPVYDYGDGSSTNFTRQFMSMSNPVGNLYYNTSEYLNDVFDGKWYITLTPIDGLSISGNAGYYLTHNRTHLLDNPFYGQTAESKGMAYQISQRGRSINLQAIAEYSKTFNDVHNIDLMVGYETFNYEVEDVEAIGYNLYRHDGWDVNNTIDRRNGYGSRPIQYTTRGIPVRVKYNYDGKYFGHVSYRRDSSSRFAPGKRWGNFFSVSAAWDIAKENFMQPVEWIDQLKFKASFGQNGNDNLGIESAYYYAWTDQYQATGADGVWTDATLYYKGNKDITWEKSNAFNIGFDFSFLQGMFVGTLEYYQRQISDMLFFLPTAPSLGYSSYPANVGSMRNSGVELELTVNIINTKDIQWSVNANITSMANKIIKLPSDLVEDGQWINGSRIFKEGESMYNYYLVKYAGVDSETGEALYWAKQNDGTEITTTNWADCYSGNKSKGLVENRVATGNTMPKAYGGFGTTLSAYGIDFSMSFAYQFGGKVYDNTYAVMMHPYTSSYYGQNWHTDILKHWTPENPNTDVPRLNAADQYTASTSDRFMISSNYLSLNNITLGYTLPEKFTKKFGVDKIRIYGAAENVALWSKRRGLDPRQAYGTSNSSTYSPIRSFSGGLRVEF
ncbi:MAG: TonB-dependent receptor [Muribaculum sp.]|nr:TonB-dependent receptor [Muribaculum sp.]